MSEVKTAEQIAEEKALKAAADKAERERVAAEKKATKEAEKAAKAEAAKLEKERKAAEKAEQKKAEAERKAAEKAANTMPESNGVRRPKPGTVCGDAWAVFDAVSQETGAPATMAASLTKAGDSINEATLRTQYARWRAFFGITGRLVDPAAEAKKAEALAAKEAEKLAKKEEAERKKAEKALEKAAKKEAEELRKAEEKAAKEAAANKTE